MIFDSNAPFSCFIGQYLFLIGPCVLKKDARSPGVGMAGKLPDPVGHHVDSPVVPVFDAVKGLFEEAGSDGYILIIAQETIHQLLNNGLDILSMDLGNIAGEMIVASCPGPASLGVCLFGNDHTCFLIGRADGGHQAPDPATCDEDVRFNRFLVDIDHAISSSIYSYSVGKTTIQSLYHWPRHEASSPGGESAR
jgi:hypothetical protein